MPRVSPESDPAPKYISNKYKRDLSKYNTEALEYDSKTACKT